MVKLFKGTHPAIVKHWLKHEAEQHFTPNKNHELTKREKKHRWAMRIENLLGIKFNKKHFLIKN